MTLIMDIPVEVKIKFFKAVIPTNGYRVLEELVEKYPELRDSEDPDKLSLVIDVDNGKVHSWPVGVTTDLSGIRIENTGKYSLLGDDGNIICVNNDPHNKLSYEGYVPGVIGDLDTYLQFKIDADGRISHWYFSGVDLKSFVKYCKK